MLRLWVDLIERVPLNRRESGSFLVVTRMGSEARCQKNSGVRVKQRAGRWARTNNARRLTDQLLQGTRPDSSY